MSYRRFQPKPANDPLALGSCAMTPEEIFASDERIVTVREYAGFVSNAYRWQCPRVAIDHYAAHV